MNLSRRTTSTTSPASHRTARRSLRVLVATAGIAAVTTPFLSSPANAATTYYGANASAFTASSTLTHSFTVSPSTTPISGWEAGQYVVYRVAASDRTYSRPGAWKVYGWQGPWQVTKASNTTSVCTDADIIFGGGCSTVTSDASHTDLGGFTVRGYAGHRYAVMVQIGYWTGNGYSYSHWFVANDCYNTYQIQGVTFNAYGATCGT